MGFCFFNLAAIAARQAQAAHGAERVAIVDFDVHHGNGTQQIFWADASVLYASTHQMPLYPGTGDTRQCGVHDTIVNAPLSAGDGSEAFRDAMATKILLRVDAFAPDSSSSPPVSTPIASIRSAASNLASPTSSGLRRN